MSDVKVPVTVEQPKKEDKPPKKKWWQAALDAIGNAIGEAKFGG